MFLMKANNKKVTFARYCNVFDSRQEKTSIFTQQSVSLIFFNIALVTGSSKLLFYTGMFTSARQISIWSPSSNGVPSVVRAVKLKIFNEQVHAYRTLFVRISSLWRSLCVPEQVHNGQAHQLHILHRKLCSHRYNQGNHYTDFCFQPWFCQHVMFISNSIVLHC